MSNKKNGARQFLQCAAGIGTELLYAITLVVIAFVISALVLRWF